ncbi:MAG: argininosuccinate lyase [Anaerolineae bacterium]|nr:argininosuccinate lyase [Anaerolineae bacterium]
MKLWGGRFESGMDQRMERFNASIGFDWRMYDADISGSVAYVRALVKAGLLTEAEGDTLIGGLEQVRQEFAQDQFEIRLADEDIHTAVERRLHELVGPVAGKLHTGRSRNDQVATDLRLYTREAIHRLMAYMAEVQAALVAQAEAHPDALMPGYTHVQRAQPVLFAHWALSHFWPLQRDRERLADAAKRVNVLPLGAGALAGNALGVDRDFLAGQLGFDGVTPNSMDAVGDRDFVAETLFDCALLGVHLSRLGEDLVFYSSAEFGFVTLADAYSTGSSLMPQKRNPDSMELMRGKAGRLIGNLVTLLTVLKGLPATYNKDLQEDKEPLFDSLDTLDVALPIAAAVVRSLTIHPERMAAAMDDGMLATDLADYLVRKGVPFRESHHIVGRLVRAADGRGIGLRDLPLDAYQQADERFGEDVYRVFDMRESVARRDTVGGTAPSAVQAQLAAAKECLR